MFYEASLFEGVRAKTRSCHDAVITVQCKDSVIMNNEPAHHDK